MKQVWQTNNGLIFDSKEEAENAERNAITDEQFLATFIFNNTKLEPHDASQLAKLLRKYYNVTPK